MPKSKPLLKISNLCVSVEGIPLLNGVNLQIFEGEIHAIMGPNGAGKSTLAKVLAGHTAYEVTSGSIEYLGEDLLSKEPEERAHLGLFMSFQYPIEIPGVSNYDFLKMALNSKRRSLNEEELSDKSFSTLLDSKLEMMEMRKEFKERNLNEGFSGGEKKRNEILQMAVLEPKLAILDETDSGLDIDAMRIVARGVNRVMNNEMGLLLITHYQRLLDYIRPTFVHVMLDGKIVQSGGADLALTLESKGYDWLAEEGQAI